MPMVRRIVIARVGRHPAAEDLIQETLVRVLAASPRIDPGMLGPYAVVTARNVIASMWRQNDRRERNQHRVVGLRPPAAPDEACSGFGSTLAARQPTRQTRQERGSGPHLLEFA